MQARGGYKRDNYGSPVSIKGPKSGNIDVSPEVMNSTDAGLDKKAGVKLGRAKATKATAPFKG